MLSGNCPTREFREWGIIVRHFPRVRIDQHLRVTVGTPAKCVLPMEALSHILNQKETSR